MKQNNILKPVFALLLLAAIGLRPAAEETEKSAVSAVLENGTKNEEISEYEEKKSRHLIRARRRYFRADKAAKTGRRYPF